VLEVAGTRLTLRVPEPADADGLFALACDPEVTRWLSWGPYTSADEPLRWIEQAAAFRDAGERLELVIRRGDEVLGMTGLMEISMRDRRAMVGTWLGREHWGTGVNRESKELILHLGFKALGLNRIGAYSNVDHVRSQRALERLGFRRECVLRRWHRHPDGFHDVVVFGLLAEEWEGDASIEVRGELPAALRTGATPTRNPGSP
jgi:[ribosomal protein S5]-alanine N-acetyltransferase